VTYPQAGDVLSNGNGNTIANIQWTASSIPAGEDVGIALFKSDGTTLVKYIVNAAVPNTGSYAWAADPAIPSGYYQIEVYGQESGGGPSGFSGTFQIVTQTAVTSAPTVTVASPSAGQSFVYGTTMNIQWTPASTGIAEIALVPADGSWPTHGEVIYALKVLGYPVNYSGSFSFAIPTLPTQIPPGSYYLNFYNLASYSGDNQAPGTLIGKSGTFNIVAPTSPAVTVSSPVAGQSFSNGSTMNIQWSPASAGVTEIDLVNGAGSYVVYGMKPNGQPTNYNGSYSYQVAGIPAGFYNLRFYGIQGFNGGMIGQSGIITINPQSTTVTPTVSYTPSAFTAGGQTISAGGTYTVAWTSSGVNNVNLSLCTSAGSCSPLTGASIGVPASQGSFSWYADPGNLLFPGQNFRIEVTDAASGVSAYSGYFNVSGGVSTQTNTTPVVPTITSISPSTAKVGDTVTIYGSNLYGDTVVFDGTELSTSMTNYGSPDTTGNSLTFTVPASALIGSNTIKIEQRIVGGLSNPVTLNVVAPQAQPQPPKVTSINPSQGTVNTMVTISGAGLNGATDVDFYNPNNQIQVDITGQNLAVSADGSSLSFTLSGGFGGMVAAGAYQVKVVTPAGTSNGVSFSFAAPASSGPTVTLSPSSLSFSMQAASTTVSPANGYLNIAVSPDQLINWTTNSSVGWITVNPPSYSPYSARAASVSINSQAATLAPGTYTGTVTFSAGSGGASFASQTVNVTLTVTPAPQVSVVTLSPLKVNLSIPAGAVSASPSFLSIAVSPDQFINWTTQTSANWIAVNPPSYSPYSARAVSISVNAQAATLAPGTYTGTVTFSAGSGGASFASETVFVTLTVTPPTTSMVPSPEGQMADMLSSMAALLGQLQKSLQ
jgi:hypothetical protein